MGYGDIHLICPLGVEILQKKIKCEGIYAKTYLLMQFDTQKQRLQHEITYCSDYGYKTCPIYRLVLDQKYGGKD